MVSGCLIHCIDYQVSMDNGLYAELQVPSGVIKGITIGISTETDKEKLSILAINAVGEVTDPRLGFPNPTSQCSTCGAQDLKHCEGHFGLIKFPYTIQHPYFLSEVTKILNRICPGCKSIRKDISNKGSSSLAKEQQPEGCKYCFTNNKQRKKKNSVGWYPRMKFKVSSKDLSGQTAITVEIDDKLPKKYQKRLPDDYWNFIPKKDSEQEDSCLKLNRMVLSHAQVRNLLKNVDQRFIEKFIARKDALFLTCFPITPNSHRVTEVIHGLSNGKQLMFDQRTRAYKKLVDFRGKSNELSSLVHHCLKISKASCTLCFLHLEKSTGKDLVDDQRKKNIDVSYSSGLRWIKDVVLGKRNDRCFRMVVTGDPNIKLGEIGIPCHVAERLQISEHLNTWNWERLNACSSLCLLEKGVLVVRRKGCLTPLHRINALRLGDIINRPLSDGDVVLVNRPPSTHPHSMIALSVKVLPVSSVVTINPLCCSPFHGDFDGDCLHGYIPQSIDSRIELTELVALDRQLTNQQSGRNLLSFCQDSLIAAHLVLEDGVLLSHLQMQQLEMFCPYRLLSPAIVKTPSRNGGVWTGKQLFSMLLPPNFGYVFPSKGVEIKDGEIISSEGSSWLRDNAGNIFQSLIDQYPDKFLDILYVAQEVLCEWLSTRGLSVSLSDLYLSSDPCTHNIMMDEIFYGLQEAEHTCNFKQLMLDSCKDFLINAEDTENVLGFKLEDMCYEKQRSAALSQASVDAFKQVFWDIQNLAYKYASKNNSLLAMFKAGSKGNLLKLVQQSMCLGLQYSLAPLPFRFPHELSCAAWNSLKVDAATECAKSYIPYAVVKSSFLKGLNPLECFAHSVTSRDSSFSDNADLPGTLTRRLMFFMRDLCTAYDGTVRNAYGNQIVQFSYNIDADTSTPSNEIGGQPVGSQSACAISEVAYSALDQPISLLETSPLLNLKNVLECGSKKINADQTMSLYLSKKLGKRRHGFEHGALEVKNHLECLLFSDIVSTVLIIYSPQTCSKTHFSPWICHFHVCKEILKRRRLKIHSIIDALNKHYNSGRTPKVSLPNLHISSKDCSSVNTQKDDDAICISVMLVENSKRSYIELETIRNFMIPFLLKTVVKGCLEIKKVDILWKDRQKASKTHGSFSGELYLRVSMSRGSGKTNLWSVLMNCCLEIFDMIDWTCSHPDNIRCFCSVYGIGAGIKFFLNNLESAISDTGKTVLPQHLVLAANTLSATGEFVGLNAKGLAQQREHASVSSPFMQASFSNPGACFIKAAKAGVTDNLQGSIDALAWGRVPSIGTHGHFDVIYSGEGHKLAEPVDVYSLLGTSFSSKQDIEFELHNAQGHMSDKCGAQLAYIGAATTKEYKILETIVRSFFTVNDIHKLSRTLKNILHKYPIDHSLNERDQLYLMRALCFHPRREEKIGNGAEEIKVTCHPEYQDTRCFSLVRKDGTTEDFSYHKCIHGALQMIAPGRARSYQTKWLQNATA
ncbi:hypothetical protein Pint_16034 [Pistacia integerrima]|uniref:Uncharacterized protein n=1 Tax=Pistacia integerrima TaxID=434235 RepID=A0ACC0ZDW2_9ROSI|nr:hypothetical protein Pint_16034 [Pistacia integerrima]